MAKIAEKKVKIASGRIADHRRTRWRSLSVMLVALTLLVALPRIILWAPILNRLANRFGGISPLQLEIGSATGGWFAPLTFRDLRLRGESGQLLASIGKVSTTKGVLQWLRSPNDLQVIELSELEAVVVVQDGTTNLERAVEPLWQQWSTAPQATSPTTGRIVVRDARVLLTEPQRIDNWLLTIPGLTYDLPTAHQATGRAEGQLMVAYVAPPGQNEHNRSVPDRGQEVERRRGTLVAVVGDRPQGGVEVRAKADQVPIGWFRLVRKRFPQLPIEHLDGQVAGTVTATYTHVDAWNLAVDDLLLADLNCHAPAWLGPSGARVKQVKLSSRLAGTPAAWKVEQVELTSDFLQVSGTGRLPSTFLSAGWTADLLQQCQLRASGVVDFPKLVTAVPDLIPLREGLKLDSGIARFQANLAPTPAGPAEAKLHCEIGELRGIVAGQSLHWQQPLIVALGTDLNAAGDYRFALDVQADFGQLTFAGAPTDGEAALHVDLDLLFTRVRDWFELPIQQLAGTASLHAQWDAPDPSTLHATLQVNTTPITIGTPAGETMEEPAWSGSAEAAFETRGTAIRAIQRASVELAASDETIAMQLKSPLQLVAPHDEASHTQAAFQVDIHSYLDRLQRRAIAWMVAPPPIDLQGKVAMAATGKLRTDGVVIDSANWNCENLAVRLPSFEFLEPRMIGKFTGTVDTARVNALAIETLQIQSSSLSVVAQDSAAADSRSMRMGRGRFRADLGRLLRNVSIDGLSSYAAAGRVDGDVAWRLDSQQVAVTLQLDATDCQLTNLSSAGSSPQTHVVWQEPKLKLTTSGTYRFPDSQADFDPLAVEVDWGKVAGQLHYSAATARSQLRFEGTLAYDATRLSHKLAPLVGHMVTISGQHQGPLNFDWTWKEKPSASDGWLAGFNLDASLGWQAANLAGVDIGSAQLPVRVRQGVLTSAAEFPVSGGKARFDITSKLDQQPLQIRQAPQTVLQNVQITDAMCANWLKYVAPVMADATRVDGRLSLELDETTIVPAEPRSNRLSGRLIIHRASVGPGPLSNQFILLYHQLDAVRKQQLFTANTDEQQVWIELPEQRVDFHMVDGQVFHRGLNIHIGDVQIQSEGAVDVDGNLAVATVIPIPERWISTSAWLGGLRGQSLRFPITGTWQQPRVDVQQLAELGRQTLRSAATGALQQGLQRGLGKLWGEDGNPPPSAPQTPAQSPPNPSSNPLKDLGDQILKTPSLFQGLLPGGD
ncbi:MAG: hypothetical protein KatS3mg111_2586 [Pirellulaceae bacterium]|nr:MAG: hypothetical protein KatS3mg111_2586 [Pirellulaceae bacterium]